MNGIVIDTPVKKLGFSLVLIATLIVTLLAVGQGVENWYAAICKFALLIIFGGMPPKQYRQWFSFVYLALIVLSGVLLFVADLGVAWSQPMTLGLVIAAFAPPIEWK